MSNPSHSWQFKIRILNRQMQVFSSLYVIAVHCLGHEILFSYLIVFDCVTETDCAPREKQIVPIDSLQTAWQPVLSCYSQKNTKMEHRITSMFYSSKFSSFETTALRRHRRCSRQNSTFATHSPARITVIFTRILANNINLERTERTENIRTCTHGKQRKRNLNVVDDAVWFDVSCAEWLLSRRPTREPLSEDLSE